LIEGALLAYAFPRHIGVALVMLVGGSAAMELLQILVERHPRALDALFGSLGAVIGIGLVALTTRLADPVAAARTGRAASGLSGHPSASSCPDGRVRNRHPGTAARPYPGSSGDQPSYDPGSTASPSAGMTKAGRPPDNPAAQAASARSARPIARSQCRAISSR